MSSFEPFNIGTVPVGGPTPFFILGPCALESEAFAWEMARSLKEIADKTGIHFIFKASFDKANRTSVSSFRGPGPEEGCRILGEASRLDNAVQHAAAPQMVGDSCLKPRQPAPVHRRQSAATPDPERRRCYNRAGRSKFAGETGVNGKKVDE